MKTNVCILFVWLIMGVQGLLPLSTCAHAAVLQWTNRYDGPGNTNDQATAIAADINGNVLVTGYSTSANGFPDRDFVTIKYSSTGLPLWTNRYDGPAHNNDAALAIALDTVGNVFVTGDSGSGTSVYCTTIKYSGAGILAWINRFEGFGVGGSHGVGLVVDESGNVCVSANSVSSSTAYDYATIKYSNAGVPLWTNTYNGLGNYFDVAAAIAVGNDGSVFVTGKSASTNVYPFNYDYVTIKYSSTGSALWTNRYGGAGNYDDQASAIATDTNGNVFVTGNSARSDTYPYHGYATIKYSGAGVALWTNRYDGSGTAEARAKAIAVDSFGCVVVTGGSRDNGGEFDYVTIKYSNSGVPIWTNSYDGPGNFSDLATAVAVDRNGNVFVSGYSASANTYPYDDDLETIAYSSAGVLLWAKRYSGPGTSDDIATAITVDGDGSVLVAGYSPGSTSYQDYVTIKYGPALLAAISLQIEEGSGSVVLRWENAAFTLQTAHNSAGMFTNIPGATTPYTNPVTADQQFFRLISN